MIIIAGLGNPDKKYDKTRHNVGFAVIDALADRYNVSVDTKKHKGLCANIVIGGQKVLLLKPLTYMNLSGESVVDAMNYYKLKPEDVIVISDDINLAVGRMRIRGKGSAGGHNGLKNIIAHLSSEEFARVRLGVGEKPPRMDLADFVLSRFPSEEEKIMCDTYKNACDAIEVIIGEGIEKAMNRYN